VNEFCYSELRRSGHGQKLWISISEVAENAYQRKKKKQVYGCSLRPVQLIHRTVTASGNAFRENLKFDN
jgi:predicted alternative tryptophan synthase beta-subunit